MAAILVLPSTAVSVRGAQGEMTLPPLTPGMGPEFYRAAEYILDVGDKIDYSFSASGEVLFFVLYRSVIDSLAPVTVKLREANVSRGHGVLEADWAGDYSFGFGSENTTASITVSYSIHEPWLAEWGLVLGLATAAAIVLVAGIVIVRRTKRKGV